MNIYFIRFDNEALSRIVSSALQQWFITKIFFVEIFYFWDSMSGGGLSDHKILYMLLFIGRVRTENIKY